MTMMRMEDPATRTTFGKDDGEENKEDTARVERENPVMKWTAVKMLGKLHPTKKRNTGMKLQSLRLSSELIPVVEY